MRILRRLFIAAAVIMGGTAAEAGHQHHEHPAQPPDYQRLAVDEPAAPFALRNQEGERISLSDLHGRAAVLTFMYTSCTDICPLLLHTLATVEEELSVAERSRVTFVGITVDPQRDTPERLRAFMAERGLSAANWVFLTGALPEVEKVANDYGVVVRPAPNGDFVHNSVFVVIDPRGQETVELHGAATPAELLAAEIRNALN